MPVTACLQLPACLQQLLFWNRFQHTENEATNSRLCHNSYAIKIYKNKYFVPEIPNPLLKAYISKTTESYLPVKAHSKYGQLTDEHKI